MSRCPRARRFPRRRTLGLGVVAAVAGLWTTPLGAEAIGLFFDTDCLSCSRTIALGTEATLYVNALRDGLSDDPLVGAEFRVVGLPPAWSVECTPNPVSLIALGDPFGIGADIAFDSAPQPGACVNLYTCRIRAITAAENVYLQVVPHVNPGWNVGACPVLLCTNGRDPHYPDDCIFCAATTQAIVNGPTCDVAIQPIPWTRIKSLYR